AVKLEDARFMVRGCEGCMRECRRCVPAHNPGAVDPDHEPVVIVGPETDCLYPVGGDGIEAAPEVEGGVAVYHITENRSSAAVTVTEGGIGLTPSGVIVGRCHPVGRQTGGRGALEVFVRGAGAEVNLTVYAAAGEGESKKKSECILMGKW